MVRFLLTNFLCFKNIHIEFSEQIVFLNLSYQVMHFSVGYLDQLAGVIGSLPDHSSNGIYLLVNLWFYLLGVLTFLRD